MSNLIPEGWQLAPITEFASLKHGHQFRTPDFSETGVRVIKIGQVVGGGKVSLKNCDFVRSDVYEETKGFELKGGEILMSLTGNIGRVGIVPYVPYPLLQNYRVGLFSPTNGKCDKEYLAQILGSELVTQQLIDKSNVTAQANFGKADLEQVIVQMPPLPEQQKIATILSSVDDVIEKTRAQIDKLKDLKTGMMQELLTKGIGHTEFKDSPVGWIPSNWDVGAIDSFGVDILDGDRGNEYPKEKDFYPFEHCLFLSAKNVTKKGFAFTTLSFITKEKDELLRKGKLTRGDIVITTRGTVGNIAFYDDEVPFDHIRINSGMAIIRNKSEALDSQFLHLLMNSPMVSEQVELLAFGSAQPQLTIGIIKGLNIPVIPPFSTVLICRI